SELGDRFEMSEDMAHGLLAMREPVVALDVQYDDDSYSLLDSIADENVVDVRERILGEEARSYVERALAVLSERERHILALRYGLNDGVSRSLREVSREVDLSQEGVRRIERRAFDKLRYHDVSEPLTQCA